MSSRAQQLLALGQSVWLDFIRRGHLASGEFDALVRDAGVVGVTSNPTIFQQAIAKSADYDAALSARIAAGLEGEALFESLAIEDIQMACDHLKPLYDASRGLDGRVSIEVSPRLANDGPATFAAAKRLRDAVGRDNVMIKIPATKAGLPAVTSAIAAGISVNVTLIFSLARYREVMDAYLAGLEQLAAAGGDLSTVRSVASFFVSRVDTLVDKRLQAIIEGGGPRAEAAQGLLGRAAVANARLAYADFKHMFGTERFARLQAAGARVQRPLWASTGTKNPAYSDVVYVDELIGPDTVNTVPPQTLAALLDHGRVALTLATGLDEARQTLAGLEGLGISMSAVTNQLEQEGVQSFAEAFASLLAGVAARRAVPAN